MGAFRCHTCNADWSGGAFSETCDECGGGAMSRGCLMCGGRCGAQWHRAPIDSNDSGMAHWGGGCGLPKEEQQRLMREWAERDRAERDDTAG